MGLKELESSNFRKAVTQLEEARERFLGFYQTYPDSPYHGDIPGRLALLDRELGDVFYGLEDYPKTWRSYRNSLSWKFPNNEEHRLAVHRLLVKTYEAAEDYEGSIEIFNYLLDRQPHGQTLEEAVQFLEKNSESLVSTREHVKAFRARVSALQDEIKEPSERNGGGTSEPTKYKLPIIREFYSAVELRDYPGVFSKGYRILKNFPGRWESRDIIKEINRAMIRYLDKKNWTGTLNKILRLYPLKSLNDLGFDFWRNGLTGPAARAYKSILHRFPNEIRANHKALFFLGRIREDQRRFDEALQFYERLVKEYNYGPYYPAASFKMGWIYRLQKKYENSKAAFERILEQRDDFISGKAGQGAAEEFIPASYFWLAQVESSLSNEDRKIELLDRLVEEYQFDFYSIVTQLDRKVNPLGFLNTDLEKEWSPRKMGLGDESMDRIKRAEELVSIGLLKEARAELAFLDPENGDEAYLIYLARLRGQARDFQNAIGLTWNLFKNSEPRELSTLMLELLFPQAYIDRAKKESALHQLDPFLVLALMRQESAFNHRIISRANAIGLMQMIPSTAKRMARANGIKQFDLEDLKKPEINIYLGVYYLKQLLEKFEGNPVFALAAYNAGPRKVKNWKRLRDGLSNLEFVESIPYNETRNYVKKVLRNYVIYKSYYGSQFLTDLHDVFSVKE